MKDLRNMTDYEIDRHFTCEIPEWCYWPASVLIVSGVAWLASPLIVGVIGIARGLF